MNSDKLLGNHLTFLTSFRKIVRIQRFTTRFRSSRNKSPANVVFGVIFLACRFRTWRRESVQLPQESVLRTGSPLDLFLEWLASKGKTIAKACMLFEQNPLAYGFGFAKAAVDHNSQVTKDSILPVIPTGRQYSHLNADHWRSDVGTLRPIKTFLKLGAIGDIRASEPNTFSCRCEKWPKIRICRSTTI